MAIIKIRNTAIDLDAAEIPNLDASKISTGTFDASRIGSGTFADARIAASNVSQHATSFDDNKLVNDISTLAIRQASNENKGAYNTNSMFVDVFQDSSGIGSFTTSGRNNDEYVNTNVLGTASVIDFDNIDGSNTAVEYKATSNLASGLATSFTGFSTGESHVIDSKYILDNSWSGVGSHWGVLSQVPRDSTDRNNYYIILDFKASYLFGGVWYFGKQNGYGDLRKVRLQSSLDDSTYTDIDMSSVTRSTTARSNGSQSGSEGEFTAGASDGSFRLNQHASEYYSTINTLGNFPSTNMRYLKLIFMNQWTGSSNTNAGFSFNITKQTQTFSATGNFISNAITAPSSVSSMGAIITYQNQAGTNALNTDLVLKLSADNGSNYSTATLTAMPDFSTGIKMAKVNDLSVTAGTSLKYKIEFANQASGSKEARIRGVSLQY